MANYVVSDINLTLIADAIRAKSGHNELLEWPNEYKTSIDNLNPVDMCIKTDTDDVVSVSDAAQYDAKNVSIKIEPVQDLHGYDSPWPAGGGVNKWDEEWELGAYNVSSGEKSADGSRIRNKNFISVVGGQSYYLHLPYAITTYGAYLFKYDSSKAYISGGQITDGLMALESNVAYINFCTQPIYGTTYKNDISVNYPATDTAYHPYSNICPITGWTGAKVTRTGKNLFDYRSFPTQTEYGITITNNNDGTFTLDGESVAIVYFDLFNTQFRQSPLPYGTYTLSGMPEGAARNTFTMYVRPTYSFDIGNGVTFTDSVIGGSIVINSGQVLDNVVIRPQLEPGSTATDYEPYQGETYDITFPSEAGTVYGGTLDVTNGVLTVERAMVDLSTLSYGFNAGGRFYNTSLLSGFKHAVQIEERATGIICSNYKPSTVLAYSDSQDNYSWLRGTASAGFDFIIKDSRYTNVPDFKTAMSGVQLVYELATPITYTLTPQQVVMLRGNNTLWADTGDTTLKYFTMAFEDLAEEIGFADGGDY